MPNMQYVIRQKLKDKSTDFCFFQLVLLKSLYDLILFAAFLKDCPSHYFPVAYLLFAMVITTLTVAVTVAVLRLHHADPQDPPPNWLRILTYKFLARITCLKVPNRIISGSRENVMCDSSSRQFTTTTVCTTRGKNVFNETGDNETNTSTDYIYSSGIINKAAAAEYKFIARVIDKFFAGFFFLIFVVGTPMLLYVYPVFWVARKTA